MKKLRNSKNNIFVECMTDELYQQGYREVDDSATPAKKTKYHIVIPQYTLIDDVYVLRYISVPAYDSIYRTIQELTKKIVDSDYIIQKFSEYNLNPSPEARKALKLDNYNLNLIMAERQELRNTINNLKGLLK